MSEVLAELPFVDLGRGVGQEPKPVVLILEERQRLVAELEKVFGGESNLRGDFEIGPKEILGE